MLSAIDCTKLRLASVHRLIQSLMDGDFPYPQSRGALVRIQNLFSKLESSVSNAARGKNKATIDSACSRALEQLFFYMPFLGFILRSTNVRTAFEIHGPLNRAAKALLGGDVNLLVSSEWDYSPYTYQPIPQLQDFVLIGLPASESGNPLILPLAGHEFGHSVWWKQNLLASVKSDLVQSIHDEITTKRWNEFRGHFPGGISADPADFGTTLFDQRAIVPATEWSCLQAEETFCDFLGVRLFGESFLHAIAFLLSPGPVTRAEFYPGLQTRFGNLETASSAYGVTVPEGFSEGVTGPTSLSSWNDLTRFQVSLADGALIPRIDTLIEMADEVAETSRIPGPNPDASAKIVAESFRRGLPAPEASHLTDILNAGWQELLRIKAKYTDPEETARHEENLSEIVLKSIEIIEVEALMKSGVSA